MAMFPGGAATGYGNLARKFGAAGPTTANASAHTVGVYRNR